MIIIYNKETKEVMFNGAKPLDYSKNEPVYNVITDPETREEIRELAGYTMYYNPEVFDTAEVPDTFRDEYYTVTN